MKASTVEELFHVCGRNEVWQDAEGTCLVPYFGELLAFGSERDVSDSPLTKAPFTRLLTGDGSICPDRLVGT